MTTTRPSSASCSGTSSRTRASRCSRPATANGHLHSRPMTTQNSKVDEDDSLWFFMSKKGDPVADFEADPTVNVAYANPSKDQLRLGLGHRGARRRPREEAASSGTSCPRPGSRAGRPTPISRWCRCASRTPTTGTSRRARSSSSTRWRRRRDRQAADRPRPSRRSPDELSAPARRGHSVSSPADTGYPLAVTDTYRRPTAPILATFGRTFRSARCGHSAPIGSRAKKCSPSRAPTTRSRSTSTTRRQRRRCSGASRRADGTPAR